MPIQIRRTVACGRCGEPATQIFGEAGGKGWYESLHCPSCGESYEADGGSPTPEEFRRAIMAEEGEWALDATAPLTVVLLKALRAEFGLSLAQAQELKKGMPGELRRGTRHEMENMLHVLQPSAEPGTLVVRQRTGP
jgi:hypothetical protein